MEQSVDDSLLTQVSPVTAFDHRVAVPIRSNLNHVFA